jgi:hypothetical protein
MNERANPFGDLGDLASAPAKPKPDPAVIDQVAEAHGFPSRQPAKAEPEPAPPPTASVPEAKLRQKVFRLTPDQDRTLKQYCAGSDTTIQDLVVEGINMVLKSKGLPTI